MTAPLPVRDLLTDGLSPLLALRPDLHLDVEAVDGGAMPRPYRDLLVHDADMTSTLEHFHGVPIELEPLLWRRDDAELRREVRLVTRDRRRPVEYGAIRIELDAFEDAARREIVAGETPLGAILARHAVDYRSRPDGFFGVRAAHVEAALDLGQRDLGRRDLARPVRLWGRVNRLTRARDGRTLAAVVEILPPVD